MIGYLWRHLTNLPRVEHNDEEDEGEPEVETPRSSSRSRLRLLVPGFVCESLKKKFNLILLCFRSGIVTPNFHSCFFLLTDSCEIFFLVPFYVMYTSTYVFIL